MAVPLAAGMQRRSFTSLATLSASTVMATLTGLYPTHALGECHLQWNSTSTVQYQTVHYNTDEYHTVHKNTVQ